MKNGPASSELLRFSPERHEISKHFALSPVVSKIKQERSFTKVNLAGGSPLQEEVSRGSQL